MPHKRRIAALLCALFLVSLTCDAVSRDGLYFVAVENMVLPLTEDTMPFWHDGYLYISGDVFTGSVRDTLGISRAKIGDGLLLYRGEQSLLFRRNYPYAQDSEQNTYAPGMVWHGEQGYVPASVVARYFNLLYSTVDVEHGKLVWLRSTSFTMQDKAFGKAAAFQLNTVYREYLDSLEAEEFLEPEPGTEEEAEGRDESPAPADTDLESVTPDAPESGSDWPDTSVTHNAPSTSTEKPSAPPVSVPDTPTPNPAAPSVPASNSATPAVPASNSATPAVSALKPAAPPASGSNPVTPSAPASKPVKPPAPVPNPVTPSVSATPPASASNPVTPSASTPAPAPAIIDSPAVPETPPESVPQTRSEQRIFLCLRGDSNTSVLLDTLERHDLRATVFCDETFLSEQGDLLRRMTATGYRVGLYVPSGPPASVLDQLETCNLLLQRTTMEKTRLVFVDGAGKEPLRAVRNAGFLPFLPDLDAGNTSLRTSRQASELLSLVSRQAESVSVWLGGTVSRSGLNMFLNDALELHDTFLPWTETGKS